MDFIENYHFMDKNYTFVALYAPIFEKYTDFFWEKKNSQNSRKNISISAVLSHISDT